jgi:2-haloalkanoic acid dehalogenase type II
MRKVMLLNPIWSFEGGGNKVLKAVLFDLGDTLVKTADNQVGTYQRILEACGIHRTREELNAAHVDAGRLLGLDYMASMLDEYWVKRNTMFLEHLGIFGRENLARMIAEQWWDYSNVALYSDVKETLDRLKQRGIKMGVITNALQTDLEKILSKTNLNPDYFKIVVTINTICRMKPELEIFHYALSILNVAPQEALFVGDTIEYDYEGAKKAGLKALLIDRENRITGDYEKIRDLREVLALV